MDTVIHVRGSQDRNVRGIDYGPGYRVYYIKRGRGLVILLAGGDKRTQAADIKAALQLARKL